MTTEWKEVTDHEELFRLKREGWEIQAQIDAGNDKYCPFKEWTQRTWSKTYLFRARYPQPKMKKIKMLCYFFNNKYLAWYREGDIMHASQWIRIPAEDKEIEVPDGN